MEEALSVCAASASYDAVAPRLLQRFGGEQRVLRGARLLGLRDEQTHLLVGSPPLGVELAVVAERHLHTERRGGIRSTIQQEHEDLEARAGSSPEPERSRTRVQRT